MLHAIYKRIRCDLLREIHCKIERCVALCWQALTKYEGVLSAFTRLIHRPTANVANSCAIFARFSCISHLIGYILRYRTQCSVSYFVSINESCFVGHFFCVKCISRGISLRPKQLLSDSIRLHFILFDLADVIKMYTTRLFNYVGFHCMRVWFGRDDYWLGHFVPSFFLALFIHFYPKDVQFIFRRPQSTSFSFAQLCGNMNTVYCVMIDKCLLMLK